MDAFPSDTKKNPKDCMEISLRSGRKLKEIEEIEKKMAEIEKHVETGEEIKTYNSEVTEEERTVKVQQKQPVGEVDLRKKKRDASF